MKIGIDARMIHNSGIGTYIQNLILYLPRGKKYEYILFGDPANLKKYELPVVEANFPIYSLSEQLLFPNIIKNSGIDIFHSTHYNIPLFNKTKMVTTIHDLIHLIFPQYLPNRLAYYYAKLMIGKACRKSRIIIADSENTKEDIIKYFDTNPSRIAVINLVLGEKFKPSEEKSIEMKKNYGKYILYIGAIREHKNIIGLIKAFYELKKKRSIEHKLILIGKHKEHYFYKLMQIINNYGLSRDIINIENAKTDELQSFYCGADLFVFPSFYEGFGLPPLEAMACGCPVVAANTSSLPEVMGDAGLMADPYNVEDLANSISRVITDRKLKENMIKNGLERAKIFSKERFAEQTIKVYESVYAKN
ncbi:MAG: glycosyltransferase family 4 protein [Endomicrobiales bacterium]|nr:glycosyltransferase family 4 protein [Endomicrobiales bacterium]